MQLPRMSVESQQKSLVFANVVGAILYMLAASRGGWAIPAEREAGIHSVTGEPFIWFMSILPIVAVFFVINVVWVVILARRRWVGGRFWLLAAVIWTVAIVIDFAHH